jgi:hypothetical protein
MRIAPGTRDSGLAFQQSLAGQRVDRVFVSSVERGKEDQAKREDHAADAAMSLRGSARVRAVFL